MAESTRPRRRLLAALLSVASTLAAGGCAFPARSARLSATPTRPAPASTAAPSTPAPSSPATLVPTPVASTAPSPAAVVVPAGVQAGVAVYDRVAGGFVLAQRETATFRSASLVKL